MKLRKQMETLIEEMLNGQILLDEALFEFEKLYIEKCLERNKNHISKTAKILGKHRNTLTKRIASYNQKTMVKKGSR